MYSKMKYARYCDSGTRQKNNRNLRPT